MYLPITFIRAHAMYFKQMKEKKQEKEKEEEGEAEEENTEI